ncbi:type II secretion system protein [Prosthecobacter dejongeii]|uniref:Prepilin-type N-terminal cleavage/methylation domain-containing protein n=1 Tax=Prosthecobacter dejongeii TaxID=48465 RepID=A0A7W7YPY5_9BACT|nr:type II secretion system protein [Prosthecobacter dejongeii]MBB5040216.1 prepilin-type N-terminal cleavage/methylation domain-containing protein [Prosthecobacter dejongeii]
MKIAIHSPSSTSGFSLFEMLMTVSILAIMSTMALAWFGGSGSEVRQARDQRNAQTLCTLCQAVEAAGMPLTEEGHSPMDIARRLVEGVTIETGALKGRTFHVPGLGAEELHGAVRFLSIQDGQMRYDVSGQAQDGKTRTDGEI